MLKVFLVEDEFVVREGIKNNINWKQEGYEFCGEASDGELAYPMIENLRPDIIITDIRMPFMDGLELSRLVKDSMPEIRIIILSGHEEFDYAKKAINIGVEEYLLKPIKGEDLLKAVHKVGEKILQEQEEKRNREKFKLEMQENETEAKRQLFHDMIRNTKSLPEILEKGKSLNLNLSASAYNIILLKVWRTTGEEGFSNRVVRFYEELDELLKGKADINLFDRNLDGVALIIKGDTPEELKKNQDYYIEELEKIIATYNGVTYFGGIGEPVNRLRQLGHSFDEASRAFAYRFILDEEQFLNAKEIEKIKLTSQDGFHMDMVDTAKLDKQKVDSFLRRGELEEIGYFLEEYLRSVGSAGEESVIFRQYLIMDLYFSVAKFLEELGVQRKQEQGPFENPVKMSQVISHVDVTKKYLVELFREAMERRNEVSTKKYEDLVEMTKRYIEENYHDEELSLNTAASYVNISPSHLSAVFSQEMGKTFVKYLTDHRMNKAMELLRCTNKRSNEVSTAVGYKDPHYFSYLFKKTQGVTPMQYRAEGSQG